MAEVIVAANWKMNTKLGEAVRLVTQMKPGLEALQGVQTVICPPFISLAAVRSVLEGTGIALGAQNMHPARAGAFTGEVSPSMLIGLCEFVIVGHSERRYILGEDDDFVNRKIGVALDMGLRPIFCVGERLPEREEGRAEAVVERQVRAGLEGVDSIDRLVVAYEPVWAIGTGMAASPQDAQAVMAHIRRVLASLHGTEVASGVSILYGGSVTAHNVADFVCEKDVNGALVGGASLRADSFVDLVRNAAQAASG